jgi:CheY-like chemotaxis protein
MNSSPTILIVDDFEDARDLMVMIFAGAGYTALIAANGEEALSVARTGRPDFVLMDIFMPVMDGVQSTRMFKEDPVLSHIPVIAYTAKPGPIAGGDGLFAAVCVKPCTPDEVLRVVDDVKSRFSAQG